MIQNPAFQLILDRIFTRSALQKKKIQKNLARRDDLFFQKAENFSAAYLGYLKKQNIDLDQAITAYLKMCQDMLNSQIKFMKTGFYPVASSNDAFQAVYSSEYEMTSYMIALAISQFLWDTHYDMYTFFDNHIQTATPRVKTYLEIGPGHGLFLTKAMQHLPPSTRFTAVDISPISTRISQSIVQHLCPNTQKAAFFTADMLELTLDEPFDFITMGEVLEHVNHPETLLKKLCSLLAKDGQAYISTCANAPAIDHVYHFKTVSEIRDLFHAAGLHIDSERVLPVEDLPMDEIIAKKIAINYCAIVHRASL